MSGSRADCPANPSQSDSIGQVMPRGTDIFASACLGERKYCNKNIEIAATSLHGAG
jgi:hypothetical protein